MSSVCVCTTSIKDFVQEETRANRSDPTSDYSGEEERIWWLSRPPLLKRQEPTDPTSDYSGEGRKYLVASRPREASRYTSSSLLLAWWCLPPLRARLCSRGDKSQPIQHLTILARQRVSGGPAGHLCSRGNKSQPIRYLTILARAESTR